MHVSSLLASDDTLETRKNAAKSVCFELLLDDRCKTRARIPLRVLVNPHDTTESIITTVKSFYGIYYDNGVSFEDAAGNTLIASYDNFQHGTTVHVRSVAGLSHSQPTPVNDTAPQANDPESPRRPSLAEPFQMQQMLPPHMREHSQSPTRRSSSRNLSKRSVSPSRDRGRRSASQQQHYSHAGSRNSSAHGSHHDQDFSDSDAGQSSISGSKRAKSEQFASSEISTANVLQDGRRGQTIFDSSTLPLFAPPQVPVTASQSSISPQRRSLPHEGPSPFQLPATKLYDMNAPPMLSPQSYGPSTQHNGNPGSASMITPASSNRMRGRNSSISQGRTSSGILPTPDPTVASCISDEDVARTLIALGDASNFSHGRTSTSTMDDTFSGAADAASSTGATSDSDEYSDREGLPKHRKYLDEGDEDYDTHIKSEEYDEQEGPKTKKVKTKMHDGPSGIWKPNGLAMKSTKSSKHKSGSMSKPSKSAPGQMRAPALPKPRQPSSSSSLNFQLGADEEDLSTKPRCQRCRKSKKGCDRQRPCGRCKDAGIGIEGCVSEDEGNGRKGRYGRHMGVPVKKDVVEEAIVSESMDVSPGHAIMSVEAVTQGSPSKKRKR